MKKSIFALILVSFILTGCGAATQQTSAADIERVMRLIGNRQQQASTVAALDPGQAVYVQIDNDSIGLQTAIVKRLESMGVKVVNDPKQSQSRITGRLIFAGTPDNAPNNPYAGIRSRARAGAMASTAARFAMGAGSPMTLVSSGISMLYKGAKKMMAPKELKGIATLYLNQNGQIREIKLDRRIETRNEQATAELASVLSQEAVQKLVG